MRHLETIWLLEWMLWMNEISPDLSLSSVRMDVSTTGVDHYADFN